MTWQSRKGDISREAGAAPSVLVLGCIIRVLSLTVCDAYINSITTARGGSWWSYESEGTVHSVVEVMT